MYRMENTKNVKLLTESHLILNTVFFSLKIIKNNAHGQKIKPCKKGMQ